MYLILVSVSQVVRHWISTRFEKRQCGKNRDTKCLGHELDDGLAVRIPPSRITRGKVFFEQDQPLVALVF